MPRIYTSESDPIDFCEGCMPDEFTAVKVYNTLGDGPDGRGNCFEYEAEHPPYEDTDYKCDICGEVLTNYDD